MGFRTAVRVFVEVRRGRDRWPFLLSFQRGEVSSHLPVSHGEAVAGVQCFTSRVSLGFKEGGKRKKQKQREESKKKKSTKGNH